MISSVNLELMFAKLYFPIYSSLQYVIFQEFFSDCLFSRPLQFFLFLHEELLVLTQIKPKHAESHPKVSALQRMRELNQNGRPPRPRGLVYTRNSCFSPWLAEKNILLYLHHKIMSYQPNRCLYSLFSNWNTQLCKHKNC